MIFPDSSEIFSLTAPAFSSILPARFPDSFSILSEIFSASSEIFSVRVPVCSSVFLLTVSDSELAFSPISSERALFVSSTFSPRLMLSCSSSFFTSAFFSVNDFSISLFPLVKSSLMSSSRFCVVLLASPDFFLMSSSSAEIPSNLSLIFFSESMPSFSIFFFRSSISVLASKIELWRSPSSLPRPDTLSFTVSVIFSVFLSLRSAFSPVFL